ncbi:MAG: ATP-binding protein [Chthoniobacter sp.]|uniref:ATP-binding protein n=1 Tax=Chthoniobacter sp. TaxID=2510640 RepID=UPI0032A2C5DA
MIGKSLSPGWSDTTTSADDEGGVRIEQELTASIASQDPKKRGRFDRRLFQRLFRSGASFAEQISVGCSLVTTLIGAVTLFGWLSGMEALASLRAHYIPMAPSTALCFALLGFAVASHARPGWSRRVAVLCAVFVGFVATAKLLEFASGHSLGFDEFFVAAPSSFGLVSKGRMAPMTAFIFVLATFALCCLLRAPLRRYAGNVATLVTALSFIVVLGYLHGTPFLYGGSIIPVALPTAVAFFFLGSSLIAAAGISCWPLRPLSGPSAGSLLLRWFLPVVIAGTLITDYLETKLLQGSPFNPALVSALATLTFALVITAVISQVARIVGGRIDRAERARKAAQEATKALNADLERRILERTGELNARNHEMENVLADLTRSHEELKGAQLQLIQAEKMQSVGSLAAGVAHEVKNPLAILEMGLGCLMNRPDLDAESLQIVHTEMKEAVSRANTVISGLLDYSSSKELGIHPCPLDTLLDRALHLMRHEFVNRKITVVRHFAPDLPPCHIDAQKIEQVFINLFTNACHAMPKNGTLTVTTLARSLTADEVHWAAGDRSGSRFRQSELVAEVTVRDTGTGIAGDQLDKVFDPFFTTKPTGQGTGLGLTVSRKIVDLHGGRLELANAPEGGALATVLFHLA